MKKYNLYLWFIALVGLITSCSQDEAAGPQNDVSNRVRIGASIEQAVQTRAASVTIPANHYLRYVLEVWSTSASSLIYKDEKTTEDATAAEFEFKLEDNGDYKVLLWADFVKKDASTSTVEFPNQYTHYNDKHYTTTNLKAVTLADDYTVNDESRDAFFACKTIKKDVGALNESITLTRPFGQINIIEKNTELLGKVGSIALTYTVPDVFDVEAGETTGTKNVSATVNTLPQPTGDRKANLFYDFIFAPESGQQILEKIDMKFTSNDEAVTLDNFEIPANMPAARNKRTNISGSILHTSTVPDNTTKLSVTVNDTWITPTIEEDIDPKVGDYYYKDGTWSTEIKNNQENPIIGVVFQVYSSSDPKYGKARGKVISPKEETKIEWSKRTVKTEASSSDGKKNTDKILEAIDQGTYSAEDYPIFNACKALRTETGNNGWYIPTNEYTAFFGYGKEAELGRINAKIKAIGGGVELIKPTYGTTSTYYWLSSEITGSESTHGANCISGDNYSSQNKTYDCKVRFILEF